MYGEKPTKGKCREKIEILKVQDEGIYNLIKDKLLECGFDIDINFISNYPEPYHKEITIYRKFN